MGDEDDGDCDLMNDSKQNEENEDIYEPFNLPRYFFPKPYIFGRSITDEMQNEELHKLTNGVCQSIAGKYGKSEYKKEIEIRYDCKDGRFALNKIEKWPR